MTNYFRVQNLFETCDPTPLALFRILFGFLMALDIPQERGLEDADIRFGDPNFCFFPLFEWIKPVEVQFACLLYSFCFIGALGICVGFKFKSSCLLFLLPYLYFFLLDKSRWNNHSYLFALLAFLLWISDAGNHLSIDSWSKKEPSAVREVPRWNLFILKFQIFILYFFAGIKKLDSDWISGYSMKNLARHRIFTPMKSLLQQDVIEYYMVHMGGLFYDLFVGFMLIFDVKNSKKLGVFLSVMFHGLNSQIFDIGMFPYVCVASLILFCNPEEFPCCLFSKKQTKTILPKKQLKEKKKKTTLVFILFYILLQSFLPFSHFITQGYNNWTPGLYGYSWDMMISSWETLHQKITIRNKVTGQIKYLDPDVWVANDRWSSHADMAVQYAHCIERNLKRFNITEVEVYFDIWKSLNGRFQQRIYDPRVDILRAKWTPFQPVQFILPLLKEYSHYRSYFENVVSNWTGLEKDAIFVADFPGLYLENFLPQEIVNITVTLIGGNAVLEEDGRNVSLGGALKSGQFHRIYTVSETPSLYFYTYTNSSLENGAGESVEEDSKILEDLMNFFSKKVEVLSRGVYLVWNAYLNVFFDVPMIVRKMID